MSATPKKPKTSAETPPSISRFMAVALIVETLEKFSVEEQQQITRASSCFFPKTPTDEELFSESEVFDDNFIE